MKRFIEFAETLVLPALRAGKETTILPLVLLRSAEDRIVAPRLALPFYAGPRLALPPVVNSEAIAALKDLIARGIVTIDAGRDLPGLVEEVQGGQP